MAGVGRFKPGFLGHVCLAKGEQRKSIKVYDVI